MEWRSPEASPSAVVLSRQADEPLKNYSMKWSAAEVRIF
jgi:hypothetical protein